MIKLITGIILSAIIGILPTYAERTTLEGTSPGGKSITALDRIGKIKLNGYIDTKYFYMRNSKKNFKRCNRSR